MKKNSMYWMLLVPMALCVASCSDNDDTTAPVVDEKEWKADAYKDTSIHPGDDFFMYCNGGWWNSTVVDETTPFKMLHIGHLEDEMKKREAALTLPSKTKVLADAAKTDAATINAQKKSQLPPGYLEYYATDHRQCLLCRGRQLHEHPSGLHANSKL